LISLAQSTRQEFANYVMYLRIMKVLHNFPADDLNYFYMLTQGMGLGQIIRELMCVCFDL
jgi:hypothetical protein